MGSDDTALRLTASGLKSFYQYRCPRQVRLNMIPNSRSGEDGHAGHGSDQNAAAAFGDLFEQLVVKTLGHHHSVKLPAEGKTYLGYRESVTFLESPGDYEYVHQLCLAPTKWPDEVLRALYLKLFEEVPTDFYMGRSFLDLVAVDLAHDVPVYSIIDVKGTYNPTTAHRIQVAYYSILMEHMFAHLGIAGRISELGQIWSFAPISSDKVYAVDTFKLAGYRNQVLEFTRRNIPRLLDQSAEATEFHIYFKCEQCEHLSFCEQAISGEKPVENWDISAIVGLNHFGKRALLRQFGRDFRVGDIAKLDPDSPESSGLKYSHHQSLVYRARALLSGEPKRLPGRRTYEMPASWDVGIFLCADRDPIEGRLATLGAVKAEQGDLEWSPLAVLSDSGESAEAEALRLVLEQVGKWLGEVDDFNRECASENQKSLQFFVFEPSEAKDIGQALERHIDGRSVASELQVLLRVFPAENIMRNPDVLKNADEPYLPDLPLTQVRRVFDSIFALPAAVSHDLSRVAEAIWGELSPYRPSAPFARRFSSRLSVDVARELKETPTSQLISDIREDMLVRLTATVQLAAWLQERHDEAVDGFLMLSKPTFQLFNMERLDGDKPIEHLLMRERLEANSERLNVLSQLAQPNTVREEQASCLRGLVFDGYVPDLNSRYREGLRLKAPKGISEHGLGNMFGVILSKGEFDLLLDPLGWEDHKVYFEGSMPTPNGLAIFVTIDKEGLRRIGREYFEDAEELFLDSVFNEHNHKRLQKYLTSLLEAEE